MPNRKPLAHFIKPDDVIRSGEFTWEQVSRHRSRDSCWIVLNGSVYDITEWLPRHPGGDIVILNSAGIDATDIFNAYHPPIIYEKMLPRYHIGTLRDYRVDPMTADFRSLAKSLEASTLMETDYTRYIHLVSMYVILLFSSIYCVACHSNNYVVSVIIGGILMAAFFQQVAFFGHDLGHTSVTHSRQADLNIGLVFGNLLSGVSLGWWKATHNTHHVITNSVSDDPDIQHLPFFAVNKEFCGSVFSTYHERTLSFDMWAKLFIPLQSKLYYIIMAAARLNLYLQSYKLLLSPDQEIRKRIKTNRWLELCCLIGFATWFGMLLFILPSWTSRFGFLVISHGLAGILHVQITLSHFSMPVYTDIPLKSDSFLIHQLKTSLDIDCPSCMDWFHGGLQFQVVHHLFPRFPRHNLRKIRNALMIFCKKHALEYHSVGFFEANRRMITHLASVSAECRKGVFWDIVNMRG
jgi:delta8-fatty-acid desaturase